ncbi:hypothetical protein [uncultured Tateyamaria sp.]|uniref:hypothetical protein n=1 Tax=uncultured Tateyamaria sp. TaxID=455651 RepID=UPI00261899CB|nr:hypothetical protein [uncultured Tateyamaria sp.]
MIPEALAVFFFPVVPAALTWAGVVAREIWGARVLLAMFAIIVVLGGLAWPLLDTGFGGVALFGAVLMTVATGATAMAGADGDPLLAAGWVYFLLMAVMALLMFASDTQTL